VEERIALGVIDNPPGGIPLTLSTRGKDRYFLKPVHEALKKAGVAIHSRDIKSAVRGIIDKLEVTGLIVMKADLKDEKSRKIDGLVLTDAGRKRAARDSTATRINSHE
jgi:hypothetical protein